MDRQETIEYNVRELGKYLDSALNGAHWGYGRLPSPDEATTRVFGIVDQQTGLLRALFSRNPPEAGLPHARTEIIAIARKRRRGLGKLLQNIKSQGRKTHRILEWKEHVELGSRAQLPAETQEILTASRDAYNERYGFIA
ncbi:MAG: hypothetical protein AABY16_00555 [Nanoarchaeota archaeon]